MNYKLSFSTLFVSISVVSLFAIMVYLNVSTLELNETIGSGLFYLKEHYDEGNMIVTEQGIGVITLPLVIGLIGSTLIKGLNFIVPRRLRTNLLISDKEPNRKSVELFFQFAWSISLCSLSNSFLYKSERPPKMAWMLFFTFTTPAAPSAFNSSSSIWDTSFNSKRRRVKQASISMMLSRPPSAS